MPGKLKVVKYKRTGSSIRKKTNPGFKAFSTKRKLRKMWC